MCCGYFFPYQCLLLGHFVGAMFVGGTFVERTSCTGVLAVDAYKGIPLAVFCIFLEF